MKQTGAIDPLDLQLLRTLRSKRAHALTHNYAQFSFFNRWCQALKARLAKAEQG